MVRRSPPPRLALHRRSPKPASPGRIPAMARRRVGAPTTIAQTRPPKSLLRELPDRLWRWTFEDPRVALWFLFLVHAPLALRLDPDKAELVPRSFLPPDLRSGESDLVWRFPYRIGDPRAGQWAYCILLLEHQSTEDPTIAVRLFCYQGHLLRRETERLAREGVPLHQRRFPRIMSLVFYTGARPWPRVTPLVELTEGPEELASSVPQWEIHFLPLRDTAPEDLIRAGAVGALLRVQQEEGATLARFVELLEQGMAELETLDGTLLFPWLRLVHFFRLWIHERRPIQEQAYLNDRLRALLGQSKFGEQGRVEMELGEKSYGQVLREQAEARGH
ncbi:MAG: Rpn family recombination-promoting nuclease/putative transposase, partial [Armatimonadetes bacterium]|nr:Rpn family recombination-promoting nuclease/putative transposase [Armatimonadota bacterium]